MLKEKIPLGFVLSASAVIAVAVVVSDQFIYQSFVVPRLNEIRSVSLIWWTAVFSPVLFCCVLAGALSKNFYGLISCAVLAAVLNRIYNYFAAITNQPGHLKSSASEAPFDFWTIEFIGITFLYCLLLIIGFFINKGKQKVLNS